MKNPDQDKLYLAILSLHDLNEARGFFNDLFSTTEQIEFAHRWEAAQKLIEGESYSQIQRDLGLSSRTVARVSKALKEGTGALKRLVKRMN